MRNAVNCYRRVPVTLALKYLQSATGLDPIPKRKQTVFPISIRNFHSTQIKKKNRATLNFQQPLAQMLVSGLQL